MKQTPVKLGPLALLLTVISICLTILSILSYATASADLRLAEKYAQTVSRRYALEIEGQRWMRELQRGGGDPQGAETDESGVLRRVFEQDGSRLSVGVLPQEGGGYRIVEWKQDREWNENTEIGSLWPGL